MEIFAYLLKYPGCSVWFLLLLGPCDFVSKEFLSCSSPARADSEVGALAPVHGIRGPGATAAVASFLTVLQEGFVLFRSDIQTLKALRGHGMCTELKNLPGLGGAILQEWLSLGCRVKTDLCLSP